MGDFRVCQQRQRELQRKMQYSMQKRINCAAIARRGEGPHRWLTFCYVTEPYLLLSGLYSVQGFFSSNVQWSLYAQIPRSVTVLSPCAWHVNTVTVLVPSTVCTTNSAVICCNCNCLLCCSLSICVGNCKAPKFSGTSVPHLAPQTCIQIYSNTSFIVRHDTPPPSPRPVV
jgi:hypothetical protein